MKTGDNKWYQFASIVVLSAASVALVHTSRDFHPFAMAMARYMLFIPVVCAAHLYGVNGGIAAALGLSTLLVPLGVGRAISSGATTFGLEIAVTVVALNVTAYTWGVLAGAQRRQRRLYQELYNLTQHVTLDPETTALAVLDTALVHVPAAGGFVMLTIDPEFQLKVLAARGIDGDEARALETACGQGETLVEWAITTTGGKIINAVGQDPRFRIEGGTPRNILAVPLIRSAEVCGGIFLFDRHGWGGFGRDDLDWVERLAEHASVSLENARLYQVSQAVAAENARYYKELKVYANELDRLVEERTAALTKALGDLRTAEADLVQTSRLAAVGELAGRVAHEILNPLTGILGRIESRRASSARDRGRDPLAVMEAILQTWGEQAASKKGLQSYLASPSPTAKGMTCGEEDLRDLSQLSVMLSEEARRYQEDLKFLETQALRLTRMVDNLRELGRYERTVQMVDPSAVIKESVEILQGAIDRARVDLIINLPSDLPAVAADADELVQVFTNLIRNAVQAVEDTGRGTGRVIIKGAVRGGRVEITIADDGIGIGPDDLDRLFETGFTTKPPGQGTGLGLNISRRFVRECRGDVELVQTAPGKGAEFMVWFPLPELSDADESTGRDRRP